VAADWIGGMDKGVSDMNLGMKMKQGLARTMGLLGAGFAIVLLLTFPLQAHAQNRSTRGPIILVVGDSLSAEYGIPRGTGWVALLEKELSNTRPHARVVNASISGETTAGGWSRLPALLKTHAPTHVIIELGGNDGLRGLSLKKTEENLMAMAQAAKQARARVLILGMQLPPNLGAAHARSFSEIFPKVAKAQQAQLVPFFLKGIADAPDPLKWFQPDRIHPSAAAQSRMLDNVWPVLKPMLQ
jgi:acyl-CoA thioesterase I